MEKIAFLGLGEMGSRMAVNLVKAGHAVTVWNRSAAKAQPLAECGATVASSPRAAAGDADVAIAMVRDDAASHAAWLDPDHGALASLRVGSVAVECSTLSVGWVRELGREAVARRVGFLDAPVVGSRPQAEAAQLIFLAGGAPEDLERIRAILGAMGGAIHHAGPCGNGTAVKLAVNALFSIQVGAVAELIGMLRAAGVDAGRALEIIAATPVASPAAKAAASAMLAGAFRPMFPAELAEKDFACLARTANEHHARTPITEAARAVFQEAVAKGFGADNLTGIVRLYT
jgi:3-hydroxyisobutyrate dehydrogenase